MSCGVGHRRGSDPELLWLAATVVIQPLPWEPPFAAGVALKRQKKKKSLEEFTYEVIWCWTFVCWDFFFFQLLTQFHY